MGNRFNCTCRACGYVWTSFFMPMPVEHLRKFAKAACPKCFDPKPGVAGADDQPIEARALFILACAIDAMSRTEPNGVSTGEWDAIVTEGTALLQRVVREGEARHG
jgi:hypothetical protein